MYKIPYNDGNKLHSLDKTDFNEVIHILSLTD